jgi:hypothetical protein
MQAQREKIGAALSSYEPHIHNHLVLRRAILSLALHLVQKVEVALVEMMDADITVLSAAGVALAGRVGGDGVEGTEVTADTTNFVLEDLVVEAGLELSLASRSSSDVHGGLTATENNEIFLGGDGGAVEGGITDVRLEDV